MTIKLKSLNGFSGSGGSSTGKVKVLNVVQTGTLTRDGAVFSGFVFNSSYLKFGESINNEYIFTIQEKDFGAMVENANNWEMVLKFKYKADSSLWQVLFGNAVSWGTNFGINTSGKLIWQFSNSGSGSSISGGDEEGSTVFVDETTYWIKIQFTGTAYQVSLSTDGTNFTLEKSPTSSTTKLTKRGNGWLLGTYSEDDKYWKGSVDLSGCYIKSNGQYWWKGVDEFVAVGNIVLTDYVKKATEITDTTSTSITIASIQPNTDYKYGTLSALTLTSVVESQLGTTIRFSSGSTATTLTDNTGITWVDGQVPTPSASKTCLIFIWNKIGFYKEW